MGSRMACLNDGKLSPSGNRVSIENDKSIYHEKQVKEMCALHALNNLMQEENAFTKSVLDNICYTLSPDCYINPHKSMFGLGNYDVNVIIGALQMKNFDTIWFDKRKDIGRLILGNINGFILNIPTEYKWGMVKFPLKRKHWVTVRKIDRYYYNLDSKLDAPEVIGGDIELISYLNEQVSCNEKELLLVVPQEISKTGSWYASLSEESADSGTSSCANSDVNKTADKDNDILGQTVGSNEIYITPRENSHKVTDRGELNPENGNAICREDAYLVNESSLIVS